MSAQYSLNGGAAQLSLCRVGRITNAYVCVDTWESPSQISRFQPAFLYVGMVRERRKNMGRI